MNDKRVAIAETQDISPISDDALVALADSAPARIEALKKILHVSLKITNAHDWVDISGTPYLETSGCEKVARVFGISWRIDEPTLEREEGGHFSYTYTGEFELSGITIDAIGFRSSRDPFFKKYDYIDHGGKKQKIELPPSEIDRGNVKKSAYTNLLQNGIRRLLGIRNLTWPDLEAAGINRNQVRGYSFKEKGEQKTTSQIKNPDAAATEAQIRAINTKLDMLGITDELARCEQVSLMAGIEPTITKIAVDTVTKGQASTVIDKLNKGA